MQIDALLAQIRRFRSEIGWTYKRLALAAGLGERSLVSMDHPRWNPTASTISALQAVMLEPTSETPSRAITR